MAIHNWNKDIHNWNINFHNWILDVHNWIMDTHDWIIKSPGIPGVTLCFCAGSYAPRNCHEMKNKRFDWILSNKCSHRVWPWLWPWPWIFKVKFWNRPISGIGRPIDNEQSGSIITMTVTFLWPRWCVRSYPIVTRVTSDVGVPLTRLVDIHNWRIYSHLAFHTKSVRNC